MTDPIRIERNPFFPFIVFEKKFNRFGETTPRNAREKVRKLRYAARKDAYIYEFYRQKLFERYENELEKRGLTEVVIAYRKLKTPDGHTAKNLASTLVYYVPLASHRFAMLAGNDTNVNAPLSQTSSAHWAGPRASSGCVCRPRPAKAARVTCHPKD